MYRLPPQTVATDPASSSGETDLREALLRLKREIPGIQSAAVVELGSGMLRASTRAPGSCDVAGTSVMASELMSLSRRTARAIRVAGAPEDLLLTLENEVHLLRLLDGEEDFLHVAAQRDGTNLTELRASIDRHVVRR